MIETIETTRTGLSLENTLSSFETHSVSKEIFLMATHMFNDLFTLKHCSFKKDKHGEAASFMAVSQSKAVYFSVKTLNNIPIITWRIYNKKVDLSQVVTYLSQD